MNMSSRKLKVLSVGVAEYELTQEQGGGIATSVVIGFSRKLTSLEVSGVKAVLEGEIK